MLAVVEISPWHWVGFIACVVLFLALDLGFFHRKAHEVRFKEALGWTVVWFAIAVVFAAALAWLRGRHSAVEFFTGYFIELSLSMDNVFVIAVIFAYFRVPLVYQHRVLFWGILGALVMRGLMIGVGIALIHRFEWILFVFGAFLVLTGIKMYLSKGEGVDLEQSRVLRFARKVFPISPNLDGQNFLTQWNGRRVFTPLLLVLILIETTDLLFALDSIPAIFGVTHKAFIIFTSNVFAILGLRSLYFVLAGAIAYFRYLKTGLAVILVFIGVKMLINPSPGHPQRWFQHEIPSETALLVVFVIIAASILASMIVARRETETVKKSE